MADRTQELEVAAKEGKVPQLDLEAGKKHLIRLRRETMSVRVLVERDDNALHHSESVALKLVGDGDAYEQVLTVRSATPVSSTYAMLTFTDVPVPADYSLLMDPHGAREFRYPLLTDVSWRDLAENCTEGEGAVAAEAAEGAVGTGESGTDNPALPAESTGDALDTDGEDDGGDEDVEPTIEARQQAAQTEDELAALVM